MPLKPTDPELYDLVKQAAREKFRGAWPSVAASAWLVQQYKSVGGGFFGKKPEHSRLSQLASHAPGVTYWPSRQAVQTEAELVTTHSVRVNI